MLRLYLDARHPGIIGQSVRALRKLMPSNRVGAFRRGALNVVQVQCYSRQWPCLLPQAGPGAKHKRPIVLTEWQSTITRACPEALVRGLIHSDGCRFIKSVHGRHGAVYEYPRYFFSNRSEGIKAIFCEHLDILGIEWRRAGSKDISIARKASVARLDEIVGPKR